MALTNSYQNISVQMTTATAASGQMLDVNGAAIVPCTTTLLNNALVVVAAALATTLRVDFIWPFKTSIYKIRIACKGNPTGRLYITMGPSSTNLKLVQNFDLSFMGANGSFEFEPRILQTADLNDGSDAQTVRVFIRDHTLLAAVPYQITFETEEYRAV